MAKKESTKKYTYALGRRKTSTAMVRLYKGKGKNTINGKEISDIYTNQRNVNIMLSPLAVTENEGKYYFTAKTLGGGKTGQRDAIKLGIARALVIIDESYKNPLKAAKLLTRDPRAKERKKPGLRKARKQEQYSKR